MALGFRNLLLCGALVSSSLTGIAAAQTTPGDLEVLYPSTFKMVDENGVDLISGRINIPFETLSVGDSSESGLSATGRGTDGDYNNPSADSHAIRIVVFTDAGGGREFILSGDGWSGTFSDGGQTVGTYPSYFANGSTLKLNGSTLTYTARDGTTVDFPDNTAPYGLPCTTYQNKCYMYPSRIARPDGEIITYYGATVASNKGWLLKYDTYSANRYTTATAVNLASESNYCNPSAGSCSYSQAWPNLKWTISGSATGSMSTQFTSIQGLNGAAWQIRSDAVANAPTYSYTYTSPLGVVTQVTLDNVQRVVSFTSAAGTWAYSYSDSAAAVQNEKVSSPNSSFSHTVTRTDPAGKTRIVRASPNRGQVYAETDELNRTTNFYYDTGVVVHQGPVRIVRPDLDEDDYSYDARGNITQILHLPKPGSNTPSTAETAGYDTNCDNSVKCNKPNWIKDARGNETDYTYDPVHGGVATVTRPAGVNGVRPQTRYAYMQQQASYVNASGQLAASGQPIWVLTGKSECQTLSSCAGSADEVVTSFTYNANLQVASQTVRAGDSSLVYALTQQYDPVGNLAYLTKPSGVASPATVTTRFLFDPARHKVGEIGPDPDGSGPLLNRATRSTYDADARLALAEQGTTTGQADANWSAFTSLSATAIGYDAASRKIREDNRSGGATHGVTQWSFDQVGRLQCSALRLNFNAGVPASACTQGTLGAYGPDRITLLAHDDAGQILKTTTGYGTTVQRDEESKTYGGNGEVLTRTDASGNLTTYEYDGLNRLYRAHYPTLGNGGVSSSTDLEQYTYDANGNLIADLRRDGVNTLSYSYDNRNNKLTGDNSSSYAYDNLDRRTAANQPGTAFSFAYDALGRRVSETTPMGSISSRYDSAGRRTVLTWPDAVWEQYSYNLVGEVTDICDATVCTKHYDYDDLGRRTNNYSANSANTFNYYDINLRLSQQTHTFNDGSKNLTHYYFYNPVNQLVAVNSSNSLYDWKPAAGFNGSYGVNSQNGYTSAGSISYSYADKRGNLTSDGTTSYGYLPNNQLSTVSNGTQLAYDGLDRLFSVVQGQTTTRFLYEGDQIVGEYTGANQITERFVPGPNPDETALDVEGTVTSPFRRYLVSDRMGSVIAMSAPGGSVGVVNTYDEAGVPGSGNGGRFQYHGAPWIAQAGLYHMRARAYSPTLGRFMQTDPVEYKGGANWYAYGGDDPVNRTDPSGLGPEGPIVEEAEELAEEFSETPLGQAIESRVEQGIEVVEERFGGGRSSPGSRPDPQFEAPKPQVNTIARNAEQGARGEEATAARLGNRIAGRQVSFKTNDGTRTRTDFVTKEKDVIETKTGNGGLRPAQQKLQNDINAGRAVTPVGRNAKNTGILTPNEPTMMRSCTVDRPC